MAKVVHDKTQADRRCRISVVIAWVNDSELLTPGLEALREQRGRCADEIIVVTSHGREAQDRLHSSYPEVSLLCAPPSTSIPALRSEGIKHATGTVVAVTEDHCIPSPDWIATIAERMNGGCAVVGGPVENTCVRRLRDWAAFLTEYTGAIGPGSDGEVTGLPGNNAAYRRELVGGLRATLESGLWESFYHDDIVRRGVSLVFDSKMLVYHHRPFDFWYFVKQRYHFCRSFADMRRRRLNPAGRLKYGLGSTLLPLLLWMRGFRTLLQKRRFVRRYLVCSPLIVVYLISGAWGEMIGYFRGGGRSLEQVR